MIGYVFGEANTRKFFFIINGDVKKFDFVKVGNIIGIVTEINSLHQFLDLKGSMPFIITEENLQVYKDEGKHVRIAEVEILGEINNKELVTIQKPPVQGDIVEHATPDDLKPLFQEDEKRRIHIGYLINKHEVDVHLNVNGFLRHVAIIAQTGAGKSYTSGVLIEELYKKGATIIVIDPHADYVFINQDRNGNEIFEDVTIFRNPESRSRYEVRSTDLIINLLDLEFQDLATLLGIREDWARVLNALYTLYENVIRRKARENGISNPDSMTIEELVNELRRRNVVLEIDDFMRILSQQRNRDENMRLFIRFNNLRTKYGSVFARSDRKPTNIVSQMIKPRHISVVDLSGLDDDISNVIVWKILNDIYNHNSRERNPLPVFIFIEEAHRFAPSNRNTRAKEIIKKIASEGRKFGICLIVITQRPKRIDQDVLSQCNSQIILRMTNPQDQNAVRDASETLTESFAKNLSSLNRGEAIITGPIIKVPAVVKVRERITREGGADIDIAEELEKIRRKLNEEEIHGEDYKDMFGI